MVRAVSAAIEGGAQGGKEIKDSKRAGKKGFGDRDGRKDRDQTPSNKQRLLGKKLAGLNKRDSEPEKVNLSHIIEMT